MLLLGRRLPLPGTETAECLDSLRSQGVQVEALRWDDLSQALAGLPQDQPLRGVFHAAGALQDQRFGEIELSSIDTVFELRSCHPVARSCSTDGARNSIRAFPSFEPCLSHHHHPGAFMGNFFACCISLPTTRLSFTSGLWMRPWMLTRKPTVVGGSGFSGDHGLPSALIRPGVCSGHYPVLSGFRQRQPAVPRRASTRLNLFT